MWETDSQRDIEWWKAESISSKIRDKERMLTHSFSFNKVLEVLTIATKQENEIKESKLERVKLAVCRWNDALYKKS